MTLRSACGKVKNEISKREVLRRVSTEKVRFLVSPIEVQKISLFCTIRVVWVMEQPTQRSVEMAERSKAAASGAVPLRRARVRTSLSIKASGLYLFYHFRSFRRLCGTWVCVQRISGSVARYQGKVGLLCTTWSTGSWWYKKGSNAKKESCCCTEPKKTWPSLPLKTMERKKRESSFFTRQFCLAFALLNIKQNLCFPQDGDFFISEIFAQGKRELRRNST